MHVSVCIVGFRNPGDIEQCLAALSRSTHPDFDVVICENGGPEAFQALQGILPADVGEGRAIFAIQAEGNLGYAGGVNRCLARTPDADAWWVLNPDTQPEPEAMARLVERLERGDCEAVGSTIHLSDGRVQSHGGRWRPLLARAESIGHGTPLADVPSPADIEAQQNYLNGASMLMGRRFVETVGPMREEYFLYCEEVEWCLRGGKLGMRLGFAPDARVLHHVGTTTGSYDDMASRPRLPIFLNERNKVLTSRDIYPEHLAVSALSSLALIFMRFGRRRAWRQIGYGVAGWLEGVANRRGPPAWMAG